MARGVPLVAALLAGATALAPDAGRSPSAMTLDDALTARRSVRSFADRPLAEHEVAKLAWAAQGITDPSTGHRTAPSAGALYPLELYVVTRDGVFHYEPRMHALARVTSGDRRGALARAAGDQGAVREAGAVLVIAGVSERTMTKYGARAERYVLLEAGHAAQNVLLEAVALGLGAVPIGAFDDARVTAAVGLEPREAPLYVIAVGSPRR